MKRIRLTALMLITGILLTSCSTGSVESASGIPGVSGAAAVDSAVEETTATTTAKPVAEYEITQQMFLVKPSVWDEDDTDYVGIVEIQNTGSTYIYLDSCTFEFEDDEGKFITKEDFWVCPMPTVIAPGEYGYFFNCDEIEDDIPLDNGFNMVPKINVKVCGSAEKAVVDYEVSELDIRDGDNYVTITGRITNDTEDKLYADDKVYVYAILYDSDGNIIGMGFDLIYEMEAGDSVGFEIDSFYENANLTVDDVADYKVYARKDYKMY